MQHLVLFYYLLKLKSTSAVTCIVVVSLLSISKVLHLHFHRKQSARTPKNTVRLSCQMFPKKANNKTHFSWWKGHAKKITNNAIEEGYVCGMIQPVARGWAGLQLFFFVRVHQFCKELSWTKKVYTQPKWNTVRVTITFSHPCKHKLTSSLSSASYTAATKLVGWPVDHLEVCLGMVLPLLSRRWWLLIFIALKQHESKTAATQNKYKQNKMIFTEQITK